MLQEEGEYEQAETEYRAAMMIHPEDPRAPLNLGGVLLQLGRKDEAMAVLADLSRRFPAYAPRARRLLATYAFHQGVALLDSGRLDEAEAQLLEARRLAPDEPAVGEALARVRAARGTVAP
jgi:Flp pilus assembly protein TadD